MKTSLNKHFKQKEQMFFNQIKPYILPGDKVVKIGNGFGYLSSFIEEHVNELKIFEVEIFDTTINKESVTLYDGIHLPVEPKSYDVAVFNLVLHHIPNNLDYLSQVISKTRRTIILYEQTYDNLIQKVQLVWRDWYINKKAGTPCKIHWNSYFKRNEIEERMEELGLRVVYRTTKRSHLYYKELLVLGVDSHE